MTYQLVLLLLVHSVIGIPLQDFFPFNGSAVCLYDTATGQVYTSNVLGSNGTSIDEVTRRDCEEFRLTPNDDGSSHNISIRLVFPFFSKRFRNVFVNTNGIISFIERQNTFNPDPFPIRGKFLISPFWGDADTRAIGEVFFKETTDASLLVQANDIIQSATTQARGLSRFNPQWMLIATWYNVGYFSAHSDKTNTFQALLVTDGRHSFVVFNYLDDGISWIRGDASQVDAQVGFNFGGESLRSYLFPTSRTAAIANIEEDSNIGSPGQYVYRVDSAVIRISITESQCDSLLVLVDPDTPSIINGGVMSLSGPSFNKSTEHENVTCVFYDEDGDDVTEYTDRRGTHHQTIKGIIVNCRAICPMPLFRKLGQHRLNVIVKNKSFFGGFEVVPAVFKTPDVHIYDGDRELEFALIEYGKTHMARWNSEQVKKDQFKENGTITFTFENWLFVLGTRWLKRANRQQLLSIVHTDYDNGNVTFVQRTNRPRIFHFDISVIVLVKHTKNLNIMYTSSILSFAQKLFGQFTGETALLEYCNLWFVESIENVNSSYLETCPCTMEGVRFDPDFISDPTCSSFTRKCHENINATVCYLKRVMNLGQQCCYDGEGKYITANKPAGSADFYFPLDYYLQHLSSDYFPYKTCCIDTNSPEFCEKYYSKRPKDIVNGTDCIPAIALPVITTHPNNNGPITAAEGSDVMLRCEATGEGTLNYQWRRKSGSLPVTATSSQNNSTLTIRNISIKVNGEYYCEVDNGGTSVLSNRVQVTARVRPTIVEDPMRSSLSIVSGYEVVTLTCKVNGDDITGGYWERINGGPLPNNNNVSSLNDDKTILQLNITEARPDHSGQYYCVVYSQWGMAQSSNALVTITIYPPTITTQPMDVSVVALQDVMFTCEARGFNVKYEWRRHSSSGSIGRQSSFILTRATPPDVDQYYCIAMTEGGYVFSNNVTLSVDAPTNIITHPQSLNVFINSSVTLSCKATGSDPISYQWRRVNGEISSKRTTGVNTPALTISPVREEDEDEYYCMTTNGGTDGMRYSDTSQKAQVIVFGPPTIQPLNTTYFGITDNMFTLNCIATNDPQSPNNVSFEWFKNGIKQNNSSETESNILGVSISQLIIHKPNSDQHSGNYSCGAYNNQSSNIVYTNTTVIIEIANIGSSKIGMIEPHSIDKSHFASVIQLPKPDIPYGAISYLFVVVTTNNETTPSHVPDSDLVSYTYFVSDKSSVMYVAAVLYNKNEDLGEKMLVLGNESISRVGDKEYYNAPLDRQRTYYTFVRAYAHNHNALNPRYASSGLSEPIG